VASVLKPIDISFLWRPQLKDPADEMVLEAAVNGRCSHIVTCFGDFGQGRGGWLRAVSLFQSHLCRPRMPSQAFAMREHAGDLAEGLCTGLADFNDAAALLEVVHAQR